MKKSTEIIPVTVFTIPAPVRGFSWAIRTTWRAAKRFWEDTEEVRWFAWEGMKKAVNKTCHIGKGAMAILVRRIIPALWKAILALWRKGKETLPVLWLKGKILWKETRGIIIALASWMTVTVLHNIGFMMSFGHRIVIGMKNAWVFRQELIEEEKII